MKKKDALQNVSRRSFLLGSGVVGASILIPFSTGLSGCSEGEGNSGELKSTGLHQEDYIEALVRETDVLIVGGGLAGCSAARAALEQDVQVTILDKGPWGHSGASGINWGHDMMSSEYSQSGEDYVKENVLLLDGMVNQDYYKEMADAASRYRINHSAEQLGMLLERGTVSAINMPTLQHGFRNRYLAQYVKRTGAEVHDRTSVLDVIVDESGNVSGAVALDLKDGGVILYRAKSVILATGSYAWVAGWNGIGAHSIASPENTGDGYRMLLNAGVAMRDMEELPCDFVQWTPLATREGMGAMGASTVNWDRVFDKDGNPLMTEEYWGMAAGGTFQAAEFMRAGLSLCYGEGAGPNGGLFVNTADIETDDLYYRHVPETMDAIGYDLPEMVELCPEQWESAGIPFDLDPKTSGVNDIAGLYVAGAAAGMWQGSGYITAQGTGFLAGEAAAKRAVEMESVLSINTEQVESVVANAFDVLQANPSDGVRASEVFRMIQESYWKNLGPFKTEEGILAAIDDFDRIENEILPKMYVPSKSRVMNSDWRKAIEAHSLLQCAKATAQASLLRKESRGAFCRVDYPEIDHENYLRSTKVQFRDGKWTAELADLVDTIVSADEMRALWAQSPTIGFPIQ